MHQGHEERALALAMGRLRLMMLVRVESEGAECGRLYGPGHKL
jgi:hypothetical protein